LESSYEKAVSSYQPVLKHHQLDVVDDGLKLHNKRRNQFAGRDDARYQDPKRPFCIGVLFGIRRLSAVT